MAKYKLPRALSEKEKRIFAEYPKIVQTLLVARGIETKEKAEKFLSPDWERDTYDPFRILGMDCAVKRIFEALDTEEKILIYGDYDCDGIPGSVVLHDFFKKIGYENFSNYIPHRHDEGYGFHSEAVKQASDQGVKLIITVDVGITNHAAVETANHLDVDVIITDHHLPIEEEENGEWRLENGEGERQEKREEEKQGTRKRPYSAEALEGKPSFAKATQGKQNIPNAYAVLNSKQSGDTYPDDMLCGCGVAFKLVQALLKRGREEGRFSNIPLGWEKWLLDMVGLSTIVDMVPLQNENRVLVRYGLEVMKRSRRRGLMALLQKTNVSQKDTTEDDIGFMVGPRINAASRMDHPIRAFELLTASDDAKAIRLANYLDGMNDRRKGMVASMIKEAKHKLRERELREVIVLGNPVWHPGLLGLTAHKIMEEYARPAFVWGRDGSGVIKGSCRSGGEVSVVELMRSTKGETFLQFGGHDGAGGFSLTTDAIHTLEEELSLAYRSMNRKSIDVEMVVDTVLSLDEVNWGVYREIEKFAPFGIGNPKPQFLFQGVSPFGVRRFGRTREHLEVIFRNSEGVKISAIVFFAPEKFFDEALLARGREIDLVATLDKSVYRKTPELRLRIVGVFPSGNDGDKKM